MFEIEKAENARIFVKLMEELQINEKFKQVQSGWSKIEGSEFVGD